MATIPKHWSYCPPKDYNSIMYERQNWSVDCTIEIWKKSLAIHFIFKDINNIKHLDNKNKKKSENVTCQMTSIINHQNASISKQTPGNTVTREMKRVAYRHLCNVAVKMKLNTSHHSREHGHVTSYMERKRHFQTHTGGWGGGGRVEIDHCQRSNLYKSWWSMKRHIF